MKNGIESGSCRITELLVPIELGQILGNEIATISSEVLEIPRAKIINYRETRLRKFMNFELDVAMAR